MRADLLNAYFFLEFTPARPRAAVRRYDYNIYIISLQPIFCILTKDHRGLRKNRPERMKTGKIKIQICVFRPWEERVLIYFAQYCTAIFVIFPQQNYSFERRIDVFVFFNKRKFGTVRKEQFFNRKRPVFSRFVTQKRPVSGYVVLRRGREHIICGRGASGRDRKKGKGSVLPTLFLSERMGFDSRSRGSAFRKMRRLTLPRSVRGQTVHRTVC